MTEEASAFPASKAPYVKRAVEPLPAAAYLFNPQNLDRYQDCLQQGLDLVRSTIASVDKPVSGISPHELAKEFQSVDLNQPVGNIDEALEEVGRLYLKDAVYFHHPRYVAHLNCPVVMPAILAELISTSINTAVETWDQSGGATFIEQKLVDWTAERIGLGMDADGVFTSGGTQSNLMAMLLARDHACDMGCGHENKVRGLPQNFAKLRIFTSEMSHFSVQKAAAILGLGYDAVVPVRCDDSFRMDFDALREEVESAVSDGLMPMAVVATGGTTDFGSIDPIAKIAAFCREHGIWMHVDAAYGCGLLVSKTHRHLLHGIEQADSVTVDYHKSFFQPVSCSAFLVRQKKHLSPITYYAEYLNPLSQSQEGTPNLVNKSIQTTRRFDALKLWLTLRTIGADGIGEAFDQVLSLAGKVYLLFLSDPNIEVIHQPQMSTLVFRYCSSHVTRNRTIDAANIFVRKALAQSGEALVAGTKINGRQYLKFTLLNPDTTIQDIQMVIRLIKKHGKEFFEETGTLDEQEDVLAVETENE